MKVLSHNKLNIKDEEVSLFVTRVKAFVVDSQNKIWIATSNGGCQLPGGHVEKGEDLKHTLIRELKEEAGVDIDSSEISGPFFELRHYTVTGDKRKRLSNILYFYVKTDKMPDRSKTNFTPHEREYNFTIGHIEFDKVEEYVKSFMGDNQTQINKIIAQEVLDAFYELKEFLNK